MVNYRMVLLALALCLALTGIGGATGQEIRFNLGAEPQTLDPAKSTGVPEGTVKINLFEGLTRVDENNSPKPGMAKSWEISADGKTYIFHLRTAYWSNGDVLTAHDFEYAWKRVLDPKTAAPFAYQLFYINNGEEFNSGELQDHTQVGVRALDEKTLQVELIAPTPYFLSLTALPTLLPVHAKAVEANPENWFRNPETMITNGPFIMTKWDDGQLESAPNSHYWDAVSLDKLVFTFVEAVDTEYVMFETGQLQITTSVPRQDISRLEKEGLLRTAPSLANYYYIFNTNVKPLDDVRVRQALSMAINRQEITQFVTKAGEVPAYAYIPPGIPDPQGQDFRAVGGNLITEDVQKAQELLAQAGFAGGEGFPVLEIVYNTFDLHRDIAEVIQEYWSKNLGITVTLTNHEWVAYLNRRFQGDFQIARAGWNGDYLDPMTFMEMYVGDGVNNHAGWSNEKYDALVDLAKITPDAQKRMEALHEGERIFMEDMPVMPIFFYVEPYLQKDNIHGVNRSLFGFVDFTDAQVVKE